MKPNNRGGTRPGAGRPRLARKKEQRPVTLAPDVWQFIATYRLWSGCKNDSQAIEKLIRSHILYREPGHS